MQKSYQSTSPRLVHSSTHSSGLRREVLWNVLEPGDPYDIRKSMIGRLPGDQCHFMGDKLQIVCLLQSAEIERLCQFLDEYKFRYRQIQRQELDRHSYQIQIKQLTQQLEYDNQLRMENAKLKDFIKKQTGEIQESKNMRFGVDSNLRSNYDSALKQIQYLMKDNSQLKSERQQNIAKINTYTAKISALESARQIQLKQLTDRYHQQSKFTLQTQIRTLKTTHDAEITRLEFQLKRLRQFNQAKNIQINDINTKNRNLLLQLEQLTNNKNTTHPAYLEQMQQRFVLLGQQIQRLNLRIRQSTARIDQSSRNQLYWKDKFLRLETDYKDLELKTQLLSQQNTMMKIKTDQLLTCSSTTTANQIKQLENQIKKQKMQIIRFQQDKLQNIQKYNNLQQQYRQLQYNSSKIATVQRQNTEMKASLLNISQLKRKSAQYQSKIITLTHQLQNMSQLSKISSFDKKSYEQLQTQYQQLKNTTQNNEKILKLRYQSQMERRVIQYQSKLARYAQDSGNQFQSRLQAINREVQKLTLFLKQKTQQSEENKKKMRELQNTHNEKYQIEVKRQYTAYQLTIKQLKTYIDELTRRQRDYDALVTKAAEYENAQIFLNQEIQKLTHLIQSKDEQLEILKRKIQQSTPHPASASNNHIAMSVDFVDSSRRMVTNEQLQQKLTRQNNDLRNKLQQIVDLSRRLQQYQNCVNILGEENNRLKLIVKQKIQLLNRSQINSRNVSMQIQSLRRNMKEIQLSYSQIRQYDKLQNSRKFTNYQQSLSAIQQQYEQLRKRMMDLGNDSTRKTIQYQNKIVLLSQQIERLNKALKLRISEYEGMVQNLRNELQMTIRSNHELQQSQRYNFELSQRAAISQQTILGLSHQIQSLLAKTRQYQTLLHKKSQQILQLQNRYRVVSHQYEHYKYQVKHFEEEVNRNYHAYQSNIQVMGRDNDQLKRCKMEYQNRIGQLAQEHQRLSGFIRASQYEQEAAMRRNTNQIKMDLTQKYELEASRKIMGYEQMVGVLTRECEQSKRKIIEYENTLAYTNRQLIDRTNKLIQLQSHFQSYHSISPQKPSLQPTNFSPTKMLQQTKSQLVTSQASPTRVPHQQQLNRLTKIIAEFETQFLIVKQELERVNLNLKNKIDELHIVEAKFRNMEKENQEFRKIYKEDMPNQVYMGNYQRENSELKQKLAEQSTKVINLSQQFDRLNGVLKLTTDQLTHSQLQNTSSQQQLQNYRKRILELQKNHTRKLQLQLAKTVNIYQQNINTISKQYEELKRQLSSKTQQYENKIMMMTQELERNGQNQKMKKEDIGKIQKMDSYKNGIQNSDEKSVEQSNIAVIRKQFQQYQLEAKNKIAERQKIIVELTQQCQNLKIQLKTNQPYLNQKIQLQTSKKISTHEQPSPTSLNTQIQQSNRNLTLTQLSSKYTQNQSKLIAMGKQILRLNTTLKATITQLNLSQSQTKKYYTELQNMKTTQSPQLNQLQSSYTQINKQYQNSKKHLIEYQQNIRKLYTEFQRLQQIINQLRNQRQILFDKNQGLVKQIDRLTQQNNNQQLQIRQLRIDFSDRVSLQKRINQHMALMVVLFAQIQTLRERIKNKQQEVREVRRASLSPLKA